MPDVVDIESHVVGFYEVFQWGMGASKLVRVILSVGNRLGVGKFEDEYSSTIVPRIQFKRSTIPEMRLHKRV